MSRPTRSDDGRAERNKNMEKTFILSGTEYTVCECTAIAKDLGESERRKALYVWSISESGEKDEFVLFDYDLPEDEYEFFEMCEESPDWDGWFETIESVEITE